MPARKLGRRWRQATLVAHLVSAGAWIGIDVIVATLVLTGALSDDRGTRSVAYQAVGTFVVWPMLVSGLPSTSWSRGGAATRRRWPSGSRPPPRRTS